MCFGVLLCVPRWDGRVASQCRLMCVCVCVSGSSVSSVDALCLTMCVCVLNLLDHSGMCRYAEARL